MRRSLRIGNGGGFWGDSPDAPVRIAEAGRLDYLTIEYLAELTMSILALQKRKDSEAGYAKDFPEVLRRLVPSLKAQPNLKIVTNAGGMNPTACASAAKRVLNEAGLSDHRVALVAGDDLFPRLPELIAAGHGFHHLDSGEPLEPILDRVVSANAYLGAAHIAQALGKGASVVVTGRVADASLALGPCLHEFGWPMDDWHRLAAGTVAGHLIECGAQATGGLWMNADDTTNLAEVGYPIAEVGEDGRFVLTKPAGTGGVVNLQTVGEQLLYEVGDPARYLTPDVVADFTAPTFRQVAADAVECTGAKGLPATDSYKVSIAYHDGFIAAGTLTIFGPGCVAKAQRSGAIILAKLKASGFEFENSLVEVLGTGACVPGVVKLKADPLEVVLRVVVRDPHRAAVERFTREFAPLVTSGFAATTGYTTGRATVREVFAYWPALVKKTAVASRFEVL